MFTRFRLLALSLLVFVAGPAFSQSVVPPGPLPRSVRSAQSSGVAWADKALNTTQNTDWMHVEGFNLAVAEVTYTWNAATHVTMKCWESDTGVDARAFEIPACDEAVRPNADCEQKLWRYITAGASKNFRFYIPIGSPYLKCQFSSVAGTASDVANTVKFVLGVQ